MSPLGVATMYFCHLMIISRSDLPPYLFSTKTNGAFVFHSHAQFVTRTGALKATETFVLFALFRGLCFLPIF
eukprot:g37416.t1